MFKYKKIVRNDHEKNIMKNVMEKCPKIDGYFASTKTDTIPRGHFLPNTQKKLKRFNSNITTLVGLLRL